MLGSLLAETLKPVSDLYMLFLPPHARAFEGVRGEVV